VKAPVSLTIAKGFPVFTVALFTNCKPSFVRFGIDAIEYVITEAVRGLKTKLLAELLPLT
jgi:hypothetical protein